MFSSSNLLYLSFHLFKIDFPLFIDANRSTWGINRIGKDSNRSQARDDRIVRWPWIVLWQPRIVKQSFTFKKPAHSRANYEDPAFVAASLKRRSNDLRFAGNPFPGVGGRSGFCPAFVGAGSIIYKRLPAQPTRAISRPRRRSDATYRLLRPVAQYHGLWHLNDFFGAHFPRRRSHPPFHPLSSPYIFIWAPQVTHIRAPGDDRI